MDTEATTTPTTLDYALFYAVRLGWYVFPIKGATGASDPSGMAPKEPYGLRSWTRESSNDPQQIVAWFAGAVTGLGIGLDCGKSGLVAFDGDRPQEMSAWLGEEALRGAWRLHGNPERTTWLFRQGGERIGCPIKGVRGGEVKGSGGYIALPPSFHYIGGAYQWLDRPIEGGPPVVPSSIVALLPTGGGEQTEQATSVQVSEALTTWVRHDAPWAIGAALTDLEVELGMGHESPLTSRHASAFKVVCWVCDDSRAGLYPLESALTEVESRFRAALEAPGPKKTKWSKDTWLRMVRTGVGNALAKQDDEVLKRRERAMKEPEGGGVFVDWVKTPEPLPVNEPEPIIWETPDDPTSEAEALPLSGLPILIQDVVREVSTQSQTSPEIALCAVLGVLSACTRGAWEVEVHDGWGAGPTLWWGCALANSGERKDAAFKPIRKPLDDAEEELRRIEHKKRDRAQMKHDALLAEAKEHKKAGDYALAADALDQARRAAPRLEVRMLLDDATTEGLGVRMTGQRGPAVILSTEATAFRSVAGGYSEKGANTGLLNKAYDCTDYTDARAGRDAVTIRRATLTWAVAVQPDVMGGFANQDTEGSGFLYRFTFFTPQRRRGHRISSEYTADPFVMGRWARAVRELHRIGWQRFAALTEDATQYGHPMTLKLDLIGKQLVMAHDAELEPRKLPGGDLESLMGWIEKHPARIARIAALFALLDDPTTTFVEEEHVRAALSISEGLIEHAQAAMMLMRGAKGASDEQALLGVLRKVETTPEGHVSTRDIFARARKQAWVRDTEHIRDVLAGLQAIGWVRDVGSPPRSSRGGRPSDMWALHPDLLKPKKGG